MYQWNKFYEAETGLPNGGEGVPQLKTEPKTEPKPDKTFTQEEVNALVAKEKAKYEKVTAAKLQEFEEAQKLAKMSEAERQAIEFKKMQEKLQEYESKDLVNQFKLELTNKKLPSDFAEHIPVGNAEKAKAAVDFLSKYTDEVMAPLNARIEELTKQLKNASLRGEPPKSPSGTAAPKSIPHLI